jgi:O-antigen ligase
LNSKVLAINRNLPILDIVIKFSLIGVAAFSLFSISLTQICVVVGALSWIIKASATRSWGNAESPLGYSFLFFFGACILAVLFSGDITHGLSGLKKMLLAVVFFWAVNCIDIKNQNLILKVLFTSSLIAASYGFYQALSAGISENSRVDGTMSIYMTFAGVLMLVLLMALSRLLFHSPKDPFAITVLVSLTACLFLTLTRQAWLGVLMGGVFLIFIREKKLLLAAPFIVAIAIALSPVAVKERIYSMVNLKDRTLEIRMQLWAGGWEIFKDNPLIGCGFKCVDRVFSKYPEHAEILKRYKGLHNNFIQLAVDVGFLGLSAWMSIWVLFFLEIYRRKPPPGDETRWIYFGSAAGAIGFLSGGFFEVNFYDSEVVMLMYFLMAMPFAIKKLNPKIIPS